MKLEGRRKSDKVQDLQDKYVGPKKHLVKTKAAKAASTEGRLIRRVLQNSGQTEDRSLSKVDTNENTKGSARFTNTLRKVSPVKMGLRLKNKKLDTPKKLQKLEKKKK